MDKEAVISKVEKLFSLGNSSNENEAQAAIAKARQLMAQYHIEAQELGIGGPHKEAQSQISDERFTKRSGWWKMGIAEVIADHMSCKVSVLHMRPGGKTYTYRIYGFAEDITMCRLTIDYAISSVEAIVDYTYGESLTAKSRRMLLNSVGVGFVLGLEDHYSEQDREEGWGLVLPTPEAVQTLFDSNTYTSGGYRIREPLSESAYNRGYQAGKNFGIEGRLSTS